MTRSSTRTLGVTVAVALLSTAAAAQYAERNALFGSGQSDLDVSGRSVKEPRVRAVHTDDNAFEGGTAYLFDQDPFLAYQLGRNVNFREFTEKMGLFNSTFSELKGPMVDGTTAKITADNQTSCLGCHNVPNGNPGGSANFSKDSGLGRNTPHYYGAGVMEMLAIQVRTDLMALIDTDEDGWVSVAESASAPDLDLDPNPTDDIDFAIDYGDAQLTLDTTGVPMLNHIFRVWYGFEDPPGTITLVPSATSINGTTATHYNFEMVVWGWGQRKPASALNPTNRSFLWDPFVTHGGLDSHDPSTLADLDGDGVSSPTLAGAIQFPATHKAPDADLTPVAGDAGSGSFSDTDPDGDGYLTEISEGDLDLGEWFMLNAPRPAFAGTEKEFKKGLKSFTKMGCAECHVASWQVAAADATHAGDRRFFDLDVNWVKQDKKNYQLEGTLMPLFTDDSADADMNGVTYERAFGAFVESALFTDLIHHEMGPALAEVAFDGNVNTVWRTSPLWGVGSGQPWGHDGASLTLDDVILRHGGEAQAARDKFAKASRGKRATITNFLEQMVLYDIESLPADIDGDGMITGTVDVDEDGDVDGDDGPGFLVAGVDTGYERFNAEWLFLTPLKILGATTGALTITTGNLNTDAPVSTTVIVNTPATLQDLLDAYGAELDLRIDADADTWPDVWDSDDATQGFKNGVSN